MATRSKKALDAPHSALAVEADAVAIQALANGMANEGQQKRALDWILKSACGLPIWAYLPTDRETCVALGRQFVGQQIVALMQCNIESFRRKENVS